MINYTIAWAASADAMRGAIRSYIAADNAWRRLQIDRHSKKRESRHARACRKRLVMFAAFLSRLPAETTQKLADGWKQYRGKPISVPRSLRHLLGLELGMPRFRTPRWDSWNVFGDQALLMQNVIASAALGAGLSDVPGSSVVGAEATVAELEACP